ncbi:YcbK family protein [Chelativorans salis]|uniref:Murein endopeptidase K n=1 Tax=Chelativorans salis TaxID=2978478 RepID=A0ABT2LRB0_9HYPH|nr:D-Ala-D-Ala carboxypeptidase family metallohydrolase [Chelativorans sp. EGI FJ00035]MCT7375724.1 D-Ala-D-Ala carboxypeptidase family metallohydrolase [Chelativorans sp. EGI FJ00035]
MSPLQAAMEASAAAARPSPRPGTEAATEDGAEMAVTAEAEAQPEEQQAAADGTGEQPEVTAAEETSGEQPQEEQVAEADPPAATEEDTAAKRRGFLSAFFSSAEAAPAKESPIAAAMAQGDEQTTAETAETGQQDAKEEKKPIIALASNTEATPMQASFSMDALPGVRDGEELFEIVRKSNIDDTSDLDLYEQVGTYEVASAAGLARLAPNGLLKQRESVDVSCFKPELMRMLKTIERHYGRRVLVTSGYRSREYNRRVRGARNSMHMYCAAADIQVEGVSKWELARFTRALPGRGGVGTYCHTKSVHVDVGPERDWNWNCRGKN